MDGTATAIDPVLDFPGGLTPGPHIVEVLELLRISYLPALSEGRDRKTMILAV